MSHLTAGTIVILNGTPRSGKSSIVSVVQQAFEGVWMNLGVDVFKERVIPQRFSPSIGLRPGGERPDLEPMVTLLYTVMYETIAIHSKMGLNVIVDVGHHDCFSKPLGILKDAAHRLEGLPVLFVGIRCPLDVVMERRRTTWGTDPADGSIPEPVRRWQEEVHKPGIYDLEVDTSTMSPEECAEAIRWKIKRGLGISKLHQIH